MTPAQKQVLGLRLAGLSAKEIALKTQTTDLTVKVHLRNIYNQLRSRRLPDLVRAARREGLLDAAHPLSQAFEETVQ